MPSIRPTPPATPAAAICAFLVVATVHPLAAQQPAGASDPVPGAATRAWTAGLWLGGGHSWPTGHLAKNSASDNPNLALLEVVSDLNPSRVLGGGIEVRFPEREISARFGVEHSLDADASGSVAICNLFSGELCEPITVGATLRAATASIRALTGSAGQTVRPVLSAGIGLRAFDYELPSCPPVSTADESLICEAVSDLFRDPSPHAFLRVGVGFEGGAGPLRLALDAIGTTASYQGGANRTDGTWYHDLRVEMSSSLAIY